MENLKEKLDRLKEIEKLAALSSITKKECIEYTNIFRELKNSFSGLNIEMKPEMRLVIDLELLKI